MSEMRNLSVADWCCVRIRNIPAEHMVLPAQAMACMISGLEPASVTQGWNPSDGTLLAETVANKVLHAVVKVCLPSFYCARVVNASAPHSLSFVIGSQPSDHYFHSVCWFVCLILCLFVCLCRVFLSRLWSDFDQTRTYVVRLGLFVSPRI